MVGYNPLGCPLGDPDPHYCPGGGFSWGPSAVSLMAAGQFPGVITTQWTRGQPEQVRGWQGGLLTLTGGWLGDHGQPWWRIQLPTLQGSGEGY